MIEQLHHPDKNVRSQAALHLSKDPTAIHTLLERLCIEPDLNVREDITWSLVRMGEVAVQPLIELLNDAMPAVRHHVAHTLGKLGDRRAVEPLIHALQDSDEAVRLKSAFALGQIGDETAIPALVSLLDDSKLQSTLADVLENFGESAVASLVLAFDSADWQVREQAADILGSIGSQKAVPALINALQDDFWEVRFAALMALGAIGGNEAKIALQNRQDDPEMQNIVATLLKRL